MQPVTLAEIKAQFTNLDEAHVAMWQQSQASAALRDRAERLESYVVDLGARLELAERFIAAVSRAKNEAQRLLWDLVNLKDIKDTEGPTVEYRQRQPHAWQRAREHVEAMLRYEPEPYADPTGACRPPRTP